MEKKKPIKGVPVAVETINVPDNATVCPRLSQLMMRTGGFGLSEITFFAINCVGKKCGQYNRCRNIAGKE